MNIGEAITACGLSIEQPDGHLVIVRLNGGKPIHRPAGEVAGLELVSDTYLAGGVFRDGYGRKPEDLVRVVEIQFDADLSDYLGWPDELIWSLPDHELWRLIEAQRVDLEEAFARAGVPLTRLDYTGYGLCGHLFLAEGDQGELSRIKAAHKGLVRRVNDLAGRRLLDPQVSDAGSRITRLPGCLNTKGPIHRQTKTIWQTGEVVALSDLEALAGETKTPARITPIAGGKRLPDDIVAMIVDHVRPHWKEGQRHLLALALSGMLAKAGVAEEQALAIMAAISEPADRPQEREQSVRDTYRRLEQGLATQGFFGLRELLPVELLAWLDRELGRVREASAPGVVVEIGRAKAAKAAKPIYEDFEPAPEIAFTGWVRDYLEVMEPTTEASPSFHLGCALTMAGAVFGRRISVLYGADPLYPNLYTLLIGRSGKSRKDTAIKRVTRILSTGVWRDGRASIPETKVITDVSSAEGLITILSERPNVLLYLTEFSKLMGNSRRKSTGTIIPTLIEAWDTPPVMENLNKASPVEARYPYLSILSAVQPKILADLMSDGEIHSGFANRWFFVPGSGTEPKPLAASLPKEAASDLYLELVDVMAHYEPGSVLVLSQEAQQRWIDWYIADYTHESETEEEDAMRQRHAVLIQKIALIYAICDRASAIELRHLDPAIAIVAWMWRHVQKLMGTWGSSLDDKIMDRIITVLERRGPLKRRDLQSTCKGRGWGIRDFNAVLEGMQRNGHVLVDPAGYVMLPGDDA